MVAAASPRPARPAGSGTVAVHRRGTRSVAVAVAARAPLAILTPKNHGHGAWLYTASLGGGLVDGDALALDLHVGPAATALLSTQAQTKAYRGSSTQKLHARVEDQGILVVVPDPLVCYADATCSQSTTIDLAAHASLVWVDAISAGRCARGERWDFAQLSSRVRVSVAGRPHFVDNLHLSASEGPLRARLGHVDALATVVILGPAFDTLRASVAVGAPDNDAIVATSALAAGGSVVRIAARSVESLLHCLRTQLAFLPSLLGDDPFVRKW